MSKRSNPLRARMDDLALGVRLAVGGSRTPWGRLALTAIGIGLGVAVLLLASSVQNMMQARDYRQSVREAATDMASHSNDPDAPLLMMRAGTTFNERRISGKALQPQRADAPTPPGVSEIPDAGEMIVSPALRDLLADNPLLRDRLQARIIGTIDKEGLVSPNELYYYTGVRGLSPQGDAVSTVTEFEPAQSDRPLGFTLWVVLALGVTALLVPVVVFVASTTRMAEAARERRLAALRLVGADAKQVRRIASGESLVGALLGVIVGWLLFGLGRLGVDQVSVIGFSVFPSDVHPKWWYAVLVTLVVPVIAVVTAQVSMRRTIIEPLGIVRMAGAARRKLGWRLVPLVLGACGLITLGLVEIRSSGVVETLFLVSVVLLLIAVTLLLPWVLERVVNKFSARAVPWQLALRRLQLSAGTAARSVSAVAVVVTGVIALQTVLATAESEILASDSAPAGAVVENPPDIRLHGWPLKTDAESLRRDLNDLRGVEVIGTTFSVELKRPAEGGEQRRQHIEVADCERIIQQGVVANCRDGEAFHIPYTYESAPEPIEAGSRWGITSPMYGVSGPGRAGEGATTWTAPESLRRVRGLHGHPETRSGGTWVTPKAADGIPMWARSARSDLALNSSAGSDAIERVRNVAAEHLYYATAYENELLAENSQSSDVKAFLMIRYGLLLGALVTFTLIGCSLFVTAIEQIREGRRPMAVLAAVGTRRKTLASSALLQNAVPMLVALITALVIGLLLGVLVVLVMSSGLKHLTFDPWGMFGLVGIAAASVLVVTALTLPALRRAMHPEGLRTE